MGQTRTEAALELRNKSNQVMLNSMKVIRSWKDLTGRDFEVKVKLELDFVERKLKALDDEFTRKYPD